MSQTKSQLVSNIVGNVSGGASFTGIVTASGGFSGSITGTATGLSGTPNITVGNIVGVAATFTGNVSIAGTLTYEDVTNVDSIGLVTARSGIRIGGPVSIASTLGSDGGAVFSGIVTASSFVGNLTGTASTASFATTSFGLSGTPNITVGNIVGSGLTITGISTALDTRFQSVGEKTTRINGNTASLVYNTGGGNIAICTNATGNITLAVTGIPTSSDFNDNSITFSVCSLNTGTARSCTAVTLNGFNATIRWAGGSLGNAVAGVTTSSGMDIYSFSGINTVGSASTTANYYLLGVVNGGYR